MNYGITLLKCYFGDNVKLKLTENELELPDVKNMSIVLRCLFLNVSKRILIKGIPGKI
jgi:hypothetical protein